MRQEAYITDGQYKLYIISEEDRCNYVELHRQINGEHSLFLNPHCRDLMWEQVLTGKDKVYSIFDENEEYCGSIEIQKPDSCIPELGIDLLEQKRNKGITPRVVPMLIKKFMLDNKVEYFLVRISSKNPHSKYVFEKMGAIPIGQTESTFKMFMKDFKEIVGDTDIGDIREKLKKYFNNDSCEEEEVVFEYKYIPQ